MKACLILSPALMLLAWTLATPAPAQESPAAPPAQAATRPGEGAPRPRALTLAILDFTANDPGNPDLGEQIGDALTAILSGEPAFTLVDRAQMRRVLQEHELNLTGAVDGQQAVQVGRLVGARLMVMGKVFPVGKQVWLTAKIVGTETGLVEAVLIKGDTDELDAKIVELGEALAERVRARGGELVAGDAEPDPLPALREQLGRRRLPRLAVVIIEEDMSRRPVLDPAVETEIKAMLIQCGFTIQDVPQNELADWAPGAGHVESWPRSLKDVDAVITGEAISETGGRLGNLASASARAEINVIDRRDGRVTHADRATTRGIDLAETVAGKTALENAGRQLGLRLLQHFVDTLPEAEPGEE